MDCHVVFSIEAGANQARWDCVWQILQILVSHSSGGLKSNRWVPAGPGSAEGPLPGSWPATFLCPDRAERDHLCPTSSYNGTDPITGAVPS